MEHAAVNHDRPPNGPLGVFDAGIGGIPLASWIRRRAPEVPLVYLGDAARRPYGPRPSSEVAQFVSEAEAFFAAQGCVAWTIACNTASVVADQTLAGTIPVVTMVDAVQAAAPDPAHGPVAILATAGTVDSGVFVDALPDHRVHQIATEELLRLGETDSSDMVRIHRLAAQAMDEVRAVGCATALLACTDFTALLDPLREVGSGIELIDPLEAAGNLTLALLNRFGGDDSRRVVQNDRIFLTGVHPVDIRQYAADRFDLAIPHPEIVSMTRPSCSAASPRGDSLR